MAELLKNQYGLEVPQQLAQQLQAVWPAFDADGFMQRVQSQYESFELMGRGRFLGQLLGEFLPKDFPDAVDVLLKSVGEPLTTDRSFSMSAFYYLPHTCFVAEYGLEHFDVSMHAQYELTQRFTAEFSIRPFIERYPEQTLALLEEWASDDNYHVRRLVSEGTRPRLPWGKQLKGFMADPTPVLALLEALKDDPELYVRRSVANNLNDIGKDNPERLIEVCSRWMTEADALTPELKANREWLVKHALRTAVKRCDPAALAVLGYGADTALEALDVSGSLSAAEARMGEAIEVLAELALSESAGSSGTAELALMVDFRVHFVKANGSTSAKVFKLKKLTLKGGEQVSLSKKLSLVKMSTRTLYPGTHKVELIVNGQSYPVGEFELAPSNG